MRWSTYSLLGLLVLGVLVGAFAGYKVFPAGSSSAGFGQQPKPGTASGGSALTSQTGADAPEAAAGTHSDWQGRWRCVLSKTSTPARDRELAALIEELARTDPQEALKLAQAEANWRLRDILRNAALRGWASVESLAAGNWALNLRVEERRSAVEAVMQGAAANPTQAVNTALHLCSADPEPAGDYGHYTIAALTDVGAFSEAVRFGNLVGTEKYPFLIKSAFFQWSRNQPREALAALEGVTDPTMRSQAYGEVISGWAWTDAKAVAEYALSLPSTDARKDALTEALPLWVEKDPIAASEWITKNDSGSEFDSGFEAVANVQSLIQSRPATAMEIAGNISDPAKRSHTLRAVFRQWATYDNTAAKRFIESTPNPADRTLLLDELKDMSPE